MGGGPAGGSGPGSGGRRGDVCSHGGDPSVSCSCALCVRRCVCLFVFLCVPSALCAPSVPVPSDASFAEPEQGGGGAGQDDHGNEEDDRQRNSVGELPAAEDI